MEVAVAVVNQAKVIYTSKIYIRDMAEQPTVPRCKCGKVLGRGLSARSLCSDCRSKKKASQ